MDPFTLLKFLVENANGVSVVGLSLIFAAIFAFGIVTERIHIGPEFKRLAKRAEALDNLVSRQTEELTASRIAHAESRIRLEFLEAENARKDGEIEDLKRGLESVQAELDRIRQTWSPPTRVREQDRNR